MIIKELIRKLKEYNENLEVLVFDAYNDCVSNEVKISNYNKNSIIIDVSDYNGIFE